MLIQINFNINHTSLNLLYLLYKVSCFSIVDERPFERFHHAPVTGSNSCSGMWYLFDLLKLVINNSSSTHTKGYEDNYFLTAKKPIQKQQTKSSVSAAYSLEISSNTYYQLGVPCTSRQGECIHELLQIMVLVSHTNDIILKEHIFQAQITNGWQGVGYLFLNILISLIR